MKSIEIVAPTEDVGRETISRFDMQFQAAAFAALEILEGKGIDCVYCDFHDDFVVRRQEQGKTTYHFFQVKTKKKLHHQWDLAEIFAFKKRGQKTDADSLQNVRKSFGGKLLMHGIVFDDACREVTLLSNVHFDDDVVATVEQLRGRAPSSKAAKFLAEHFCAIFEITPSLPESKTGDLLAKLSLDAGVAYMAPDREAFASAARSAIHKYSEIDLTYHETNDLANGLVDLVYRKSRTPLASVSPADITALAGVQLEDLLEVLSISRSVYNALAAGEDSKALRSASVLQRCLKAAGATDPMIEFAAQQKVNWDVWLRKPRMAELGQLVGECLERTVAGFKGSSQDIGWSANLRIRTVKALTFLERAGLAQVEERTNLVLATPTGRKVLESVVEDDTLLSHAVMTLERSYENIRAEKRIRSEV